jgi:hypothetical protein
MKNSLSRIRSKYILRAIYGLIPKIRTLSICKYNKEIQKKLNIRLIDYKKNSNTYELDISATVPDYANHQSQLPDIVDLEIFQNNRFKKIDIIQFINDYKNQDVRIRFKYYKKFKFPLKNARINCFRIDVHTQLFKIPLYSKLIPNKIHLRILGQYREYLIYNSYNDIELNIMHIESLVKDKITLCFKKCFNKSFISQLSLYVDRVIFKNTLVGARVPDLHLNNIEVAKNLMFDKFKFKRMQIKNVNDTGYDSIDSFMKDNSTKVETESIRYNYENVRVNITKWFNSLDPL